MRAVIWHDRRDVRVERVADPTIEEPTDVIVAITSTGLCGSDLHLYEVLAPFMTPGDILGHEPMGFVRAAVPMSRTSRSAIGSTCRSTSRVVTA
jgi:threonine dehydrogenase-like Zn-dependent dehydrogenase